MSPQGNQVTFTRLFIHVHVLSVAKAQSLKAVDWFKIMAVCSVQAIDIVYV